MLPVHGTNFTLHVLPGVNISHAPQREKRIKKNRYKDEKYRENKIRNESQYFSRNK